MSKSQNMNRSRKISCPMLVQYLRVMVMAVVVLRTNVSVNRLLISAFSTTTTTHHHHHYHYEPHMMHPIHFIRINPTFPSNPMKSPHDSFQTDPASRPPTFQLWYRPPLGTGSPRSSSSSSTRLNMVPTMVVASSTTSLLGAAFVSAISGGICSGGLHAIAGRCRQNYMYIYISDPQLLVHKL